MDINAKDISEVFKARRGEGEYNVKVRMKTGELYDVGFHHMGKTTMALDETLADEMVKSMKTALKREVK